MFLPSSKRAWLSLLLTLCLVASTASAFKVAISDADELRQTCSGMWAGKDTSIDLTFKPNSTGSVATIFYEWQDFPLLGTPTSQRDVFGEPVLTYICTPTAVNQKICKEEDVGNFILSDAARARTVRRERVDLKGEEKVLNYAVNQTGYYCVGATAVPLTADSQHANFDALITFHNMFKGELPGGEYPKLGFYFGLTCTYILLGAAWAYLCVKHKDELLTIQHFISGLFLILVIEQLITYAYYRYLNTHSIDFFHLSSVSGNASETWSARVLLVIESIIDSARNSASFFLLLIVSMGYGLVRPRLDPKVMLRAKLLTAVHLVCGCLYSVGIVLLSIEAGGTWVFLFIFPLAFTLTSLMMWSLNSLNATISHLTARKQTFKLAYFKRLYRILVGAVVVTGAFFVVSSVAFSQSGAESFPSQTWRYRWFLLDGWTSLLYLAVFGLIAWTWRPTGMNLRLSMSDEIATGEMEGDAEDIEMGGEYAGPGMPGEDSDDEDDEEAAKRKRKSATAASNASGAQPSSSPGSGSGGMGPPPAYEPRQSASASANDDVVFALGDEDEEGEDEAGALRKQGEERKSNASEETIRER